MKLIYCTECHDMLKLSRTMRFCACGRVYGRYLDNVRAEVSKTSISIGIGNGSKDLAIAEMLEFQKKTNDTAEREDYMEIGKGRIEYAWARPNCGAGNPHTGICDMDIRTVAFCHHSLIESTNSKLNKETVTKIVKEGWSSEKGQAFPAWYDQQKKKWVITDGNHRLEALKRLGEQFAPIVELSKEEFDHVAYQKERKLNLMVHFPEQPKIYS